MTDDPLERLRALLPRLTGHPARIEYNWERHLPEGSKQHPITSLYIMNCPADIVVLRWPGQYVLVFGFGCTSSFLQVVPVPLQARLTLKSNTMLPNYRRRPILILHAPYEAEVAVEAQPGCQTFVHEPPKESEKEP